MGNKVVFRVSRPIAMVCFLSALGVGASCSKRESARGSQPGTNGAPLSVASGGSQTNRTGKTLMEMAPADVIVSVNGVRLTKKQYLERCDQTMQRLSQMPGMSKGKLSATGKFMARKYIPGFINMQLLEQEARRTGVLSGAALVDAIDKWIARAAKQSGMKVSAFLAQVPGGADSLKREAEENVLVEAVIATNVLPKVSVPDQLVTNAIEAVRAENATADATNALKVAQLNAFRGQIVAGADFGKLADDYSECNRSAPGNNGYWGEFERKDISDAKMREAIFKLKPGELSEVLSDDEGFHLVKMLPYKEGATNANGKASAESVSLAHILLRREPALEVSGPANMRKQLFEQIKQQILGEYIQSLRAKAVIEYPNGTNFWPVASQRQVRPKVKAPPGNE